MERVAETAELLGVEASIGTSKLEIGHATKDFIAGAISGMVGILAGQPLDTLRVRLQQKGAQRGTSAVMHAGGAKAVVHDLFRGLSYPICTVALQNAVTFQSQGAAARLLTGSDDRAVVTWQTTCIAGMFAGAMSSFISSPTELLKIRMQLQQPLPGAPGYMGPLHMLRHVVGREGLMGLSRGVGMTLLRDTPSYGVYFGIYHFAVQGLGQLMYPSQPAPSQQQQQQQQPQQPLQQGPLQEGMLQKQQQQQALVHADGSGGGLQEAQQQQGPLQSGQQQRLEQPEPQQQQQQQQQHPGASQPLVQFLAGGLAGALAWMSIYPIDVVKCRLQATSRQASPYRGAWDCAVSSWRQEGSQVFIKGLGATMGRGFVVNAAIFAAFEALMDAMNA